MIEQKRGRFYDKKTIAVLPGDGIGPEVTEAAVKVIESIGRLYDHEFILKEGLIGGAAIKKKGNPLPQETEDMIKESNGILFGSVGGPEWDHLPMNEQPGYGLMTIRKKYDLYTNLRPIKSYKPLIDSTPLKPEVVSGTDILVIRELAGGIYFGEKKREEIDREPQAIDTLIYKRSEIERIAKQAFEAARDRKGKVLSVDKANVLESSRLWRETVKQCATEYPDIKLDHMLADNATMQLIARPTAFDVIVADNMFGDILSDEASVLAGSIGLLPSASFGDTGIALYEPVHGSAPDIAGKGLANPLASILSAAMMLKYSFNMKEEATHIEKAVEKALEEGYRTADLASDSEKVATTTEMADAVLKAIENLKKVEITR